MSHNALNYYGSKVRLAKRYPPPRYSVIVEPFAGGAGYSLLYHDRDVFLFDVDPRVVAAWRFLIGASPDEVLSLPDLEPDQTIHDLDVPDGARWVISKWLQTSSNFSKRGSTWARSKDTKVDARYWGAARRRKLAKLVPLVKHWHVGQVSYDLISNGPATWFVDPPYANRAGKAYTHHRIDYGYLGEWCQARAGQVIVCENEGATWLPFEPIVVMNGIARTSDGKSRRSVEVVWVKP